MMVDPSGRVIDYLRVSVTDRCDLRCAFCMPEEGVQLRAHDEILRHEEIVAVVRAAVGEGVRSVRLTGGEPLLRRGILSLVERLAAIPGLDDLALTTNGQRLVDLAAPLRAAGLRRVNVGISSFDQETYQQLTRRPLDPARVLAGIDAALAAGLSPVKVNVVVLRGVTDDLDPMVRLAARLPVEVRFIEYMPIGAAPSQRFHVPPAEIRRRMRDAVVRVTGDPGPDRLLEGAGRGPARDPVGIPGGAGHLALIAGGTGHVCASCNRLRLTADGKLRLCLYSDAELDLVPSLRPEIRADAIRDLLHEAVGRKPACRTALDPDHRMMAQIGG